MDCIEKRDSSTRPTHRDKKKKTRNVSVRSVNERIFHIGESLERNNIRARRHKCKIKPETTSFTCSSKSRFRARIASHETVEKRIAGLSAARRIRETAPAYPHFLDNEQIARPADPHLTAWFPAIDRLDRLITHHVAPSIETEVIDESIEGAHFRSATKTIFPSFLRYNSIDVNDVRSKGMCQTFLANR